MYITHRNGTSHQLKMSYTLTHALYLSGVAYSPQYDVYTIQIKYTGHHAVTHAVDSSATHQAHQTSITSDHVAIRIEIGPNIV